MPTGLKPTSSQIIVSFNVSESAVNTFTQERIDLQLNALDNEVFVVSAIKMDLLSPDLDFQGASANQRTFTSAAISKQATTFLPTLGQPTCLATAKETIIASEDYGLGAAAGAVGFTENSTDTPSSLDYIDVIATPDFYISVLGGSNLTPKSMSGKLYGYRARADAATYAALVQSELLSQ
jgi:hypothetical protein